LADQIFKRVFNPFNRGENLDEQLTNVLRYFNGAYEDDLPEAIRVKHQIDHLGNIRRMGDYLGQIAHGERNFAGSAAGARESASGAWAASGLLWNIPFLVLRPDNVLHMGPADEHPIGYVRDGGRDHYEALEVERGDVKSAPDLRRPTGPVDPAREFSPTQLARI